MNPSYQRHEGNCNCTAIAPKLQENCTRIAPELQQNPSNCTQLQQKHIGVGGGDPKYEATQPGGTANMCNFPQFTVSIRILFLGRAPGISTAYDGSSICEVGGIVGQIFYGVETRRAHSPGGVGRAG
jgi:hypothetical protein